MSNSAIDDDFDSEFESGLESGEQFVNVLSVNDEEKNLFIEDRSTEKTTATIKNSEPIEVKEPSTTEAIKTSTIKPFTTLSSAINTESPIEDFLNQLR